MARKALIHKNTTLTTNNGGVISPKLPAAGTLLKGEIAVNYKNGYETLSIENDAGEVIPFASLEQTLAYIDNSQVQADWSLNSTTANDYIKNKPDIPVINAVAETYSSTAADTTTPFTASIWRVDLSDKITELYTGLTILIKVPVAGNGTYGTLLRIDGTNSADDTSENLYPVCANVTTMISTRYAVGCIIPLTFDATQAGQTLYYNSASAYTTTANGTGWTKPGCWKIADYSTGDTTTGREGYYYLRPYAGQAVYRYKYLMEGADGRLYPIVTTNQTSATLVTKTPTTVGLRPWKIWYYNHTDTVNAGAAFGALRVYPELYTTTAVYNFNASTGTYAWIFLLGSYNKDTDLFTLDTGNNYYKFVRYNAAINWASSLTAGKYYILLGSSYSTTNYVLLYNVNPFYYFNGTNLIPVTTKIALDSGPVTSVNGLTGNVNLALGDTNVIESISVNGVAQTVTDKNVDITIEVPEGELSENYATSELENENLMLAAGDTFETAFSKVEKAIINNEETVAGALNDLNERLLDIDIPSSVSDLTDDIGIVKSVTVNGNNYTPTNGIVDLGTISGTGTGEANVLESVKVNGTALTPDSNKAVDITIPKNVSDLNNDSNYIREVVLSEQTLLIYNSEDNRYYDNNSINSNYVIFGTNNLYNVEGTYSVSFVSSCLYYDYNEGQYPNTQAGFNGYIKDILLNGRLFSNDDTHCQWVDYFRKDILIYLIFNKDNTNYIDGLHFSFIGAEEISGNRQTILYYSALYKGYKYTLSIGYDYNSLNLIQDPFILKVEKSNIQSDWNAASGDAVILNKPDIPTVPTNISAFTNDSGYITASSLVQSDWNQTDTTAADYIKNKPNIQSNGDWVSQIMFGNETTLTGSDSNGFSLDSVDEDINLNAGGKAYYNNKEIATKQWVENYIYEHEGSGNVSSTTVTTIVSLTEAEYNALATKDSSTLYIITSS